MKLLFDATELSYYNENSGHRAGVFYVALNLLREFEEMGLDITFTCDYKRYYFLEEIKEFSKYKILQEHSIINKIIGKILFATKNFPLKLKYALLILARYYDAWICRANKKNKEDLSEFDAYFSPFTPPSKEIETSSLKKFRMLHDVIPIIENGYPKSPKDWHYKIYSTINCNDYYLTNSEFTQKDVLEKFPFIEACHIKTTLLGANSNFFKTQEKPNIEGKYVFSLCTLGKRKNLISVIENFYKFIEVNNIKDLKLVLGGGIWNKFKKELDYIISKYDQSKIILTGYIKEEDLRKYYSNALCFIYPSLYEGFGLPVLEAMQCGCPVITSNSTSLPEVIGDCGITIDPKNNEAMIDAYKKMYYNEDFRQKCSRKGLERAKTFNWEKCAIEIFDFIKSTC